MDYDPRPFRLGDSVHVQNVSIVAPDFCRVSCPTLMAEPEQWALWVIVCMFSFVLVLSLIFLVGTRHQGLTSFKSMFLLLQILGSGLRVLFFSVALPWTFLSLHLLNVMLPIYVQFVTISLLVVFMWKYVLEQSNQTHLVTKTLYPVAGVTFALLGVVCVMYAYIANRLRRTEDEGDRLLSVLFAFIFALSAVCLSVVTHRVIAMMKKLPFSAAKQRKMTTVTYMFMLYITLLALRSLWNALRAAGLNALQNQMNNVSERTDLSTYYACVLAFFFFFEFFPAMCLLWMLFSWLPPGRKSVLNHSTPLIQQ
eukprot:m.90271 g.90271  ORF g.90271 m.90271 type:complete len:310 (-) comp13685_c2_seq3:198-1127(-)